jgi:hypothetical protein
MLSSAAISQNTGSSQAPQPSASPQPAKQEGPPENTKPADPEPDLAEKLVKVKRIYVDTFGDDANSKQIQAMIISNLAANKRFVITENKDRADAILRGTGLEKTSQEFHSTSESTAAGAAGGSVVHGVGSFGGAAAAIEDSSASTETINDARIAVRLVDRDGDVIWATVQESKGAKYKGASADVADKVVKQLLRDVEKATKKQSANDSKESK